MIEFIQGRTYIIGHAVSGLFVGTFLGVDVHGALRFNRVTEIVELAHGQEYVVTASGIVDGEPWRQSIDLVNYAETDEADRVARTLGQRQTAIIERCRRVTIDSV